VHRLVLLLTAPRAFLAPGSDHHREVVSTLERLRGTRPTRVDASSLALIRVSAGANSGPAIGFRWPEWDY
jgi:hypothetical protein